MEFVAWAGLLPITLSLTWIDLRTHRLPNHLVACALVLGLTCFGIAGPGDRFGQALLSSVLLFLFYFLVTLLSRGGLGMGDVKLAMVIGLYLGYQDSRLVVLGTWFSFVFAGLVTLSRVAAGQISRQSRVAFGPFMILGLWFTLIATSVS